MWRADRDKPESGRRTQQSGVTLLPPGDSSWTIMVPEIPGRCLNKPSNRAIILKQKVTSGVTTGPEINKDPNYQRSSGPIFGHRPPAVQKRIRFQLGLIPSVRPRDEDPRFVLRAALPSLLNQLLMFKLIYQVLLDIRLSSLQSRGIEASWGSMLTVSFV